MVQVVVGRHVLDGKVDREGLARTGLEEPGLREAAQDDLSLLDPASGVGSGVVQLDDVLARAIAGVGDLDRHGDGLVDRTGRRLDDLPGEVRVAQPVPEGVDDRLFVVDEPLGGCALVVAVAEVDALGVVHERRIGGHRRVGGRLLDGRDRVRGLDVLVDESAEVRERGVGREVSGPEIRGAARRVDIAGEDAAERVESRRTR